MLRVCLCEAAPCVKYEAALYGLGTGQSQPQPPSCEDNYLKIHGIVVIFYRLIINFTF